MSLLKMLGKAAGSAYGLYQSNYANQKEDWNAKRQQQRQMELNQQGHDLQMDMWNKTNYGAQIDHMKQAGLNPALMYGMGGGGGATTGSQGGGAAAKGVGQKQMGIEGLMAASQVGLNDSLGKKAQQEGNLAETKADEIKGDVISPETQSKIDLNAAGIEQINKNIENLSQGITESEARTEGYKVKAMLDRLDLSGLITSGAIPSDQPIFKAMLRLSQGTIDAFVKGFKKAFPMMAPYISTQGDINKGNEEKLQKALKEYLEREDDNYDEKNRKYEK